MRRTRLLYVTVVLTALVAPSPAGAGEPGPNAATRDFDQLHLDIRIEPDLGTGTVRGRVTIEFQSLVEGLRKLSLHCVDTRVLGVLGEDLEPLPWTLGQGVLTIDLPGHLPRGQGSSVQIAYRSTPKRGLYFHRPSKKHPSTPLLMYSQGQNSDNRRWIPCYDQPDDRFTWEVRVTVPDELETVSNGKLLEQIELEGGRRLDHWHFEDRSPSYLISLIVGDLQTVEARWQDVVLEYTAVPGHEEELETSLGNTPGMLEFFSGYLDAPYPWSRYAQTFVWDFIYGGMENTTATTLNMRALHGPKARPNYSSDGLVAHELAHMWFGDLLTCRTWDHLWLNEGFATYMTDLYFEHRDGRDEFLLRRRSQNQGYMNGTRHPEGLGLKKDPRGDRPLELFGGKQYNRGAAILHMLRLELGDGLFRDAVRTYVKRFRDCEVTSEEFRHTVEGVAGRDLRWFWDQWVYGAGYPVLEVRQHGDPAKLEVRQVQGRKNGQDLFRLTLPVRVGPTGEVQQLRLWAERHEFELKAKGPYVRVGVGGDLLGRIRFQQTRAAWEAVLAEDPDVTARLDAVEALERFGPQAVETLGRALAEDGMWAVRKACAETLARMDTSVAAGAALLGHLADADARVREAVYEGLGGRRRAEVTDALLGAVREETHDYPRAAAARSLGRVKAEGAYSALVSLLGVDSHDDIVRVGALDGLKALGDARAAGVAAPYCGYAWGGGGTQRMRRAAMGCVTALAPDTEETHRLLVRLLDDPHHGMRSWAAEACGTFGVKAARKKLDALSKHDWNGGVKHSAKQALKKL